jgi:hypothetical protein
MTTENENS